MKKKIDWMDFKMPQDSVLVMFLMDVQQVLNPAVQTAGFAPQICGV